MVEKPSQASCYHMAAGGEQCGNRSCCATHAGLTSGTSVKDNHADLQSVFISLLGMQGDFSFSGLVSHQPITSVGCGSASLHSACGTRTVALSMWHWIWDSAAWTATKELLRGSLAVIRNSMPQIQFRSGCLRLMGSELATLKGEMNQRRR